MMKEERFTVLKRAKDRRNMFRHIFSIIAIADECVVISCKYLFDLLKLRNTHVSLCLNAIEVSSCVKLISYGFMQINPTFLIIIIKFMIWRSMICHHRHHCERNGLTWWEFIEITFSPPLRSCVGGWPEINTFITSRVYWKLIWLIIGAIKKES